MKQIAFRGRLLLRKILAGLSLGAVSFLFQACYGIPMEDWEEIYGTVKSEDEEPISGIQVSVVNVPDASRSITGSSGRFSIDAPIAPSYTLLFEDIDGPKNGEYRDMTVRWRSGDGPLDVILYPKKDFEEIKGTVESDIEEPIPGIKVSVIDPLDGGSTITDNIGNYSIDTPIAPSYTVLFEDIDGTENGEFRDMTVTWHSGDGPLNVTLDPK